MTAERTSLMEQLKTHLANLEDNVECIPTPSLVPTSLPLSSCLTSLLVYDHFSMLDPCYMELSKY